MSFIVKYRSNNGRCLTGGVMEGQSCRFGNREDAETRKATILEFSPNADTEIVESKLYPEIFRHCGAEGIAQAIGGRCFGCGKVLTIADAKAFASQGSL